MQNAAFRLSLIPLSFVASASCFCVVGAAARDVGWADACALYGVGFLASYGVGSVTSWMILHLGSRGGRQ